MDAPRNNISIPDPIPATQKMELSGTLGLTLDPGHHYTLVNRALHSIPKTQHAMPREPATMRLAPHLILLAALASTPLHAQGVTDIGAKEGAITFSSDTAGDCTCAANGKAWPCRYARGNPLNSLQAVNRCTGAAYQLVCPDDPKAICHYEMAAPVCVEPPLTPVCYAADEPK